MTYILLIVVTLGLGLASQAYIKSTFNKWKTVEASSGVTGYAAARAMLDQHGLQNVPIYRNNGEDLSDYYDPKSNSLHLSDISYYGSSVASIAVACHEAGHAVQYAKNYFPVKVRGAILPAAQLGSNLWIFIIMAGIFLHMTNLIWLGVAFFAFAVLFQIVTLPVEFDASRRALQNVNQVAFLSDYESGGARKMLTAAALTYVSAALSSVLMLLYYVGIARNE